MNISNMDEHGMQEAETKTGGVLGTELTNRAYVTVSSNTTWVSVIECGTAGGPQRHLVNRDHPHCGYCPLPCR